MSPDKTHYAIKNYYFKQMGGSENGWSIIRNDPKKFNAVWRRMIKANAHA